jgi:hypothetical protein
MRLRPIIEAYPGECATKLVCSPEMYLSLAKRIRKMGGTADTTLMQAKIYPDPYLDPGTVRWAGESGQVWGVRV